MYLNLADDPIMKESHAKMCLNGGRIPGFECGMHILILTDMTGYCEA